MQNKKIFSFDIDMTLLNHEDYKITPSALLAIESLREQGHIIVLATGRNPENTDSKQFVDIVNPDAVIGLNGTLVKVGEEKIFEHFFDKEVLRGLAKSCTHLSYPVPFPLPRISLYIFLHTSYSYHL